MEAAARRMSEFATYAPRPASARPLGPDDGLLVRIAREADAEAVGAISAAREGTDPDVQTAAFRRLLERGPTSDEAFVAELQGAIVGFGKVHAFVPPADAPANAAPAGWYLGGVVVTPPQRRRGIGAALTRARLDWIAERATVAYYFASALNTVSIALHQPFGFVERSRDFWFPGVSFRGGAGILFEAALRGGARHGG